ncbi:MAG: 2-oxoacid:acceptor oxidoreductase family protein, partial [Armatimonadota bacterium]
MVNWKQGVVVRVAGEGGEGVISCGDMIGWAMVRAGLDIFTFRTFPAEIRGGPAMNQVRGVDGIALSQGAAPDLLVAFNSDGCQLHLKELRNGGFLIYDPENCEDDPTRDIIRLPIPLTEISAELKSKLSKNVIALGATGRVLGLPLPTLEAVVRERFGKKSEDVISKNVEALHAGFERIDISSIEIPIELAVAPINDHRIVMSGNESVVMGAIASGLNYYGGYPITPATEIMESLMIQLPKFGGTSIQTEDEISALASVIGASYAGAKA